MRQAQTFDFNFKNVEKQFESYQGINVKLRYVASSTGHPKSLILCVQVLHTGVNIATYGGCGQGEGHLGAFVPYAPRQQQFNQDGSRH